MSAWHSEIREEGVKWACFAEGGIRDPRMEHTMAASYQEARDWVDAAYIRKTTPKVKKAVEPVYVSELDDLAAMLPSYSGIPSYAGIGDNEEAGSLASAVMRGKADDIQHHVLVPAGGVVVPADEPDATPAASPVAETATVDQAGSAEAPAPRQKRQYRKRA